MAHEVIAGRYRLEKRLGGGGTSEVWAARDLDLDREVAVKLLAPQADRERFDREARAAAALTHPNICTLYDYGEAAGRPFMVLELLPGGSLEDRLAGGRRLPDADTQRIAAEIAAGLAHAHARGLVHRDLKPANVLFDARGRAKIADFGIARLGEGDGLTAAGTVLGTAAYISPEQAAGEPATPASDVYSFGVILYRLVTGRLPFASGDGLALVAMHRDLPPPPLSDLRPDAPPRLESVAAAALAKSPADRPSDGAALVAELGPAAQPVEETAATAILAPPARRGRTGLVITAAALLAGAGVVLAMVITFHGGSHLVPVSSSSSTTSPATAPVPPATTEPTAAPATTETTTETATTQPATTEATTAPTTAAVTTQPAVTTAPATATEPLPATTAVTTPTQTETVPAETTSPATTAAQTDTAPPG